MKKILIIEDNPEIRDNTQEILELAGYQVFAAENGKEGVEQAIQHLPDLVLCDITMPLLDGFGVLQVLQNNKQLSDVPFIFLTARTERSDFRKGMDMGADDYITKPFSAADLLMAIEGRLRKAQIKKQQFTADIQGLHRLMQEATGNQSLRQLSEERNIEKYKKKQLIYMEGNPVILCSKRDGKNL